MSNPTQHTYDGLSTAEQKNDMQLSDLQEDSRFFYDVVISFFVVMRHWPSGASCYAYKRSPPSFTLLQPVPRENGLQAQLPPLFSRA